MPIFISDAATLLTLERCQLLEIMLSGGIPIIIPDLSYKREFEGQNGQYLRELGLGVVNLSTDETAFAQAMNNSKLGYSLAECFTLAIAKYRSYILISENDALCHQLVMYGGVSQGLLWIIEYLFKLIPTQKQSVLYGLEVIRDHRDYRNISSKAGDLLLKLENK